MQLRWPNGVSGSASVLAAAALGLGLVLVLVIPPPRAGGREQAHARATPHTADAATRAAVADGYGKLPLAFEVNRGQADRRVDFLARGRGYGLQLGAGEAALALRAP